MNAYSLMVSSLLAGLSCATAFAAASERWESISKSRVFDFGDLAERSGIPSARLRAMLGIWVTIAAAACLIIGFLKGMPIFAIGLVAFATRVPHWALKYWTKKRIALLRHQMLPMCMALANVTRSGLSLPQGFHEIVAELPDPIRSEIRRLNQFIDRGHTPAEAIDQIRGRLRIDYFDIFASVMLTCYETGANYCMALERLGHSIQENERLERKLQADTAAGRSVVFTLAIFPVGFLGLIHMTVPQNTEQVFHSFAGQAVLVGCGLLTYLSVRLALSIMNIEI